MKLKKCIIISVASFALLMFGACDKDEVMALENQDGIVDDPGMVDPDEPGTSGNNYVEDEYVPYDGPIEPLTEELRPVYTPSKKWIIRNNIYETDETLTGVQTETVWADTVIDGLLCYKIAINGKYWADEDERHVPYIRHEDNGKVYAMSFDGDSFSADFQYDVICQESMTITTVVNKIVTVSRGTMVLMGKTRRAVKVWCGKSRDHISPYDYWVEGIGVLFGHDNINYEVVWPTCAYDPRMSTELLQCYDGDTKIYDHREFSDDLYTAETIFVDESTLQ